MSWTLVRREAVSIADRPLGIYFRPKVLYNRKTGNYVMWGEAMVMLFTALTREPTVFLAVCPA